MMIYVALLRRFCRCREYCLARDASLLPCRACRRYAMALLTQRVATSVERYARRLRAVNGDIPAAVTGCH